MRTVVRHVKSSLGIKGHVDGLVELARDRERATTRCRALEASKISTLLGCRGQWASQQARAGWPHFNPLLAAMGTSGRRNEFDHLPNTAPLADGEV